MNQEQGTHMRLTVFTDYTLRTLIFLALRPGTLVTIAEIADAYKISHNHLMKVVHQLALAGDVATIRGQRGGLRLGRPASEINVGAVVRRAEPDLDLMPCFGSHSDCTIRPDCVLVGAANEALRAFLAALDRYTLADLVRPRAALTRLLRNRRIGAPHSAFIRCARTLTICDARLTHPLRVDHRPAAGPPWMKLPRPLVSALPLPLREGVGGRGTCRHVPLPPTPSLKGRGSAFPTPDDPDRFLQGGSAAGRWSTRKRTKALPLP